MKPIEPLRADHLRSEQGEQILAALRRGRRMRPVFQAKRRAGKILSGAKRSLAETHP